MITTSHSVPLRSKTVRDYREKESHPAIRDVQFYNIELDNTGSVIKREPIETMDIRKGRQYMSQDGYEGDLGQQTS